MMITLAESISIILIAVFLGVIFLILHLERELKAFDELKHTVIVPYDRKNKK